MRGNRLPTDYPPWHPVIHHSLVLCFLLMMVLLPVLYIRTRQPPYWVLLIVLCSFIVIYISYWIWICCRSQQQNESENKPMEDAVTIPDASTYNPSTIGIPPSSYRVGHRPSSSSPSTLRLGHQSSFQQQYQQQLLPQPQSHQNNNNINNTQSIRSSRVSTLSAAIDQPAPPPAYHLSFEHIAVDLPQNGSPPSYHSTKEEEDEINTYDSHSIGNDRHSRRNQHHPSY